MTDRELLELAAKAAEIELQHKSMFGGDSEPGYYQQEKWVWWNPLTDDGDALRLAVKLKIDLDTYENSIRCVQSPEFNDNPTDVWEDFDKDPYAATRRAIVRAAAEIGKRMK